MSDRRRCHRALGAIVLCCLGVPRPAAAWGLEAHRWIAFRAAALTRCRMLVDGHEREIAGLALQPDTVLKPRDGVAEETHHFLDLDAYGTRPFGALPRDEATALRRFGRATIERNGVLPWHGARLARALAAAIARGDWSDARRTAGYLAHYAGDATMPLHATANYDGQRSGQRGLHQRIEARLVDQRLAGFARAASRMGRARPIPPDEASAALFGALAASYDAVGPVLAADRAARRATRVSSALYYRRLDADLHALLAARLGAAAALTAALWDGACRDAGAAGSAGDGR
ncbi:MAG TPA: hypothetical protein VGK30_03115 [Candidatus Binatia bacterium]|jgi:hypothetical protein